MMRRHLARLLAAAAVLVTATLSPTAVLASDATSASTSSMMPPPPPPPTCYASTETSPATDFSARLTTTLAAGGLVPGELRVWSRGTRCTRFDLAPTFRPERALVGIYLTTDGAVDGAALGHAAALVLDAGRPIVPAAQLDSALGTGDPGIEIILRSSLLREVRLASTWDGLATAYARGLRGQALVDAAPEVPLLVVPGARPNPSRPSCPASVCV